MSRRPNVLHWKTTSNINLLPSHTHPLLGCTSQATSCEHLHNYPFAIKLRTGGAGLTSLSVFCPTCLVGMSLLTWRINPTDSVRCGDPEKQPAGKLVYTKESGFLCLRNSLKFQCKYGLLFLVAPEYDHQRSHNKSNMAIKARTSMQLKKNRKTG